MIHDRRSAALRQAPEGEAVDSTASRLHRKRLAQLHRGVHGLLDAAVEARRDSKEVAREYELERGDVVDLFAWGTRRELRKLQSEMRQLRELMMRRAA